jgi:hypothetical protein
MIFDNLDILILKIKIKYYFDVFELKNFMIIKQKFYILVLKKNPSLILGYEF